MATTSTPNSLGLDFDQLQIQDSSNPVPQEETAASVQAESPDKPSKEDQPEAQNAVTTEPRDKKKPYVNPERVKTGGNQRDKLSEEALTERMARMREQNEKIKQRRVDIKADEDAFRKTQESERAKLAQIRKVQENVDRTREQNAKRKMDKIQSREWDSGKPTTTDWKHQAKKAEVAPVVTSAEDKEKSAAAAEVSSPPQDSGGWTRGAPRGVSQRGRGRGRGRGTGQGAHQDPKPDTASSPPAPSKLATDAPKETTS